MPKKIGIITMHIPNCGSVLQAFATQKKLEQLGFEAEIIDYLYPTKWHFERRDAKDVDLKASRQGPGGHLRYLFQSMSRRILGIKRDRKKARYLKHRFIQTKLKLSPVKYKSAGELRAQPPIYDFYLTGSDQVWNPRFAVGDPIFMCDFAPDNIPRASYAACFATETIPDAYRQAYVTHLSKYKAISVRERPAEKLVRSLTGMSAEVVCDPSLLVDPGMWERLADESSIRKEKPYLLAYIPTYAYDPYPKIVELIDDIKRQTKLDVIYIFSEKNPHRGRGGKMLNAIGPTDYVRLFRDASFVITTSLHGTAFSLIFKKSFYSVVKDAESGDSRMFSLLREVGAEDRAISINASGIDLTEPDYSEITPKLDAWRERSETFLRGALSEAMSGTETDHVH